MYKKLLIYTTFSILFLPVLLFADNQNRKWVSISGNWVVRKDNQTGFLLETRGKTYKYGYNEIINNNGIITVKPLEKYSRISFYLTMMKPTIEPVYSVIFLGGETDKDLFFLKLSGDKTGIKKVTLVSSKIIDTTKPRREKWNYLLSDIAAQDLSMDYNNEFTIEIRTNKKKIIVFVNHKEVFQTKAGSNIDRGFLGFGNNNCLVKIRDLNVYEGSSVVFNDDFSSESIDKIKMVIEKVPNKK